MQTYEISQYQRKPFNDSMRKKKSNVSTSTSYNYDTYFNSNLKKSVSFDDYDFEDKMKELLKETKMLRIENAKKTEQINSLQNQIKTLNEKQSSVNYKVNAFNDENEKLRKILNETKEQFIELENERNDIHQNNTKLKNDILNLRNQLLQEQLNKEKDKEREMKKYDHQFNKNNSTPIRERDYNNKELQTNANQQYKNEIGQLKNQIEELNNENRQLHNDIKQLRNNEYNNHQLIEENNKLKNANTEKPSINQSLLDEFKNQITKLNNHIEVLEREKKNTEKAQVTNKKINEEIVKELNNKKALLTQENDDLNKRLFDMKKSHQSLTRDKQFLIQTINQLENRIKRNKSNNNQSKTKLKPTKDNEMLIECLKNENGELKHNNKQMRKLLEILLGFVNYIASLFGHDELNLDHSKENPEEIKTSLNQLEQEIESLMNNEPKNPEAKWSKIEEKLLYKPQENNLRQSSSMKSDGEEDHNKLGKCTACNLGCNATLKGCSSMFVKKNTNPTNLPANKRINYNL